MTDKLTGFSALVGLGRMDKNDATTASQEYAVCTFHKEANGNALVLSSILKNKNRCSIVTPNSLTFQTTVRVSKNVGRSIWNKLLTLCKR